LKKKQRLSKTAKIGLICSLIGAMGSVLIAVSVGFILYGFCFYAVSNVGFIFLIMTTKLNFEQMPMWIINSIITGIGILNYSGVF